MDLIDMTLTPCVRCGRESWDIPLERDALDIPSEWGALQGPVCAFCMTVEDLLAAARERREVSIDRLEEFSGLKVDLDNRPTPEFVELWGVEKFLGKVVDVLDEVVRGGQYVSAPASRLPKWVQQPTEDAPGPDIGHSPGQGGVVHYSLSGQLPCGASDRAAPWTDDPVMVRGCGECMERAGEDLASDTGYRGRCLRCRWLISARGGAAWRRVVRLPCPACGLESW